jgi:pimeloyl-ACP methyl ester carboxylesterase
MAPTSAPDTIVLVHGFWMTPRSWEDWKARYEARGFRVLTPGYPGFDVEVEALNADPTPIAQLTAPQVIEHLESVVAALESPPIIIGHSAGGAFTQVLLDRGHGVAGVALNSAPTEGVRATPISQVRSTFPVLRSPANRHRAVGLTFDQFNYAFTNVGFTPEQARRAYERYAVPASGRILWNSVLANFQPGPQDIWVDYANPRRAPLLFLSGSHDHIMPPAVQRANAAKYEGPGTVTEHDVYAGRAHLMTSQDGWEEIADRALEWALAHAQRQPATP